MDVCPITAPRLLLIVSLLCMSSGGHAYPSGAPSIACDTMHPAHQMIVPQHHSTSPFSIQHTDTYTPGSTNTVSIQSDDPLRTIRGILLQARRAGSRDVASSAVGTWILLGAGSSGYKVIECSAPDDTVTHRQRNNDTSILFLWIAPTDLTGRIEFIVTVVEDFTSFWVQLSSSQTVRNINEPDLCDPPDYCSNGGTCGVDVGGGYTCTCPPRYTGTTCSEEKCVDQTYCGDYGICIVLDDRDACFCQPGFTGDMCQTQVTACTSNPCFNGGMCIVGANDNFVCACSEGRDGVRCELAVCVPSDYCQNGGSCRVTISGDYQCSCLPGFVGTTCETAICIPADYCSNGGTCRVNDSGEYICTCTPGYAGSSCEIDIDECLSEPCLNHGMCIDITNGYRCNCSEGFSGVICERYCTSDFTCENGGRCEYQEDVGKVQCKCLPGFVGIRCQFVIQTEEEEEEEGGENRPTPIWWYILGGFAVVLVVVFVAGLIGARCRHSATITTSTK